mmetsp:Transcript_3668/g.9927  ORF Transcript_3668/g.9927 Transcript_3668/m.9927 type:complete len:258 (+) Transcript_3668:540-1313(+)
MMLIPVDELHAAEVGAPHSLQVLLLRSRQLGAGRLQIDHASRAITLRHPCAPCGSQRSCQLLLTSQQLLCEHSCARTLHSNSIHKAQRLGFLVCSDGLHGTPPLQQSCLPTVQLDLGLSFLQLLRSLLLCCSQAVPLCSEYGVAPGRLSLVPCSICRRLQHERLLISCCTRSHALAFSLQSRRGDAALLFGERAQAPLSIKFGGLVLCCKLGCHELFAHSCLCRGIFGSNGQLVPPSIFMLQLETPCLLLCFPLPHP